MSAWTLAPCLSVLREQLNDTYPDRPRQSDGTVGDLRHIASTSDHNPDADGLVCAFDITDWPGGRWDPDDWARSIAWRDQRVKYLISDGQIWSRARAAEGWRKYSGVNAHEKHLHVSVYGGAQARDAAPWAGIVPLAPPPPPASITTPTQSEEDDDMFSIVKAPGSGAIYKVTTTHCIRYSTTAAVRTDIALSAFAGRPVQQQSISDADLAALMDGRIVADAG